jgi:O-antigen ligase
VLTYDRRRYLVLGTLAFLALANAGVGVMLADARTKGVALAVLPVTLVVIGSLIASNRAILVFGALAIGLFKPLPLSGPLPLNTGVTLYTSDILVVLAVASWVAVLLVNREEQRPSSLQTRLLGWPLLLFGITLFAGIVQGHERYGEQLVSIPLRFLLYAGIAAALTDLKPRDAYKWLVVLFYAGTVWQAGVAVYRDATGATSAELQGTLSTGGERVLGGSIAMFMAGALLLALLNLERDRRAGRTGLHLVMAALATFALVSTFQRTTFALVSVLVPLSLLAFRRIGLRMVALLPLVAPFLVLVILFIPKASPTLFPTLADRITASPSTDATANWRLNAYAAVWSQVRESPVTGVGFGRPVSFVSKGVQYNVEQDPHNQFLFLWAGGGSLLVGSFILLLAVYLLEASRRFSSATKEERRLIFFAVSLWFAFIVNSLTGIILTVPDLLLSFWILMLLPMVVRPRKDAVVTQGPELLPLHERFGPRGEREERHALAGERNLVSCRGNDQSVQTRKRL